MSDDQSDSTLNAKPERKHSILCVDDERPVLEALALTLRRKYAVTLADSATEALAVLRDTPDITVIISDMRMPFMNGAQFLAASKTIAPRARRILLTGDKDPGSAIAAVNEGAIFKFLSKPCPTAELHHAVEAAVADFESEMQERSAIRRLAEREVLKHDPLTGLESREALLERLDHRTQQRGPGSERHVVLLIDIENTEELTDVYDSKAADHALLILATRLRTTLPTAKCLARYKQNCFVALLGAKEPAETLAGSTAANVVDALERPVSLGSAVLQYRIKIGVAQTPAGGSVPRLVLRHAELALQEARLPGRPPVYVYSQEFGDKHERRLETLRALKTAVHEQTLTLLYQPIVDIERHRIYSIEALARWEHALLGKVAPDVFIPLAEQAGMMSELGGWVLERACTDASHLAPDSFPRVSVNVSVAQLHDAGFVDRVSHALATSGLAPSSLELEVTESVFAVDLDKICAVLADVRRLGVSVAIDDFGAGYSSLAYLSRLPVDILKVDGAFIRDFHRGGETIIGATLAMARKLELEVIIEGVETAQAVEQVRRLGATKIQGYHFARPMPAAHLSDWHRTFARGKST